MKIFFLIVFLTFFSFRIIGQQFDSIFFYQTIDHCLIKKIIIEREKLSFCTLADDTDRLFGSEYIFFVEHDLGVLPKELWHLDNLYLNILIKFKKRQYLIPNTFRSIFFIFDQKQGAFVLKKEKNDYFVLLSVLIFGIILIIFDFFFKNKKPEI